MLSTGAEICMHEECQTSLNTDVEPQLTPSASEECNEYLSSCQSTCSAEVIHDEPWPSRVLPILLITQCIRAHLYRCIHLSYTCSCGLVVFSGMGPTASHSTKPAKESM